MYEYLKKGETYTLKKNLPNDPTLKLKVSDVVGLDVTGWIVNAEGKLCGSWTGNAEGKTYDRYAGAPPGY